MRALLRIVLVVALAAPLWAADQPEWARRSFAASPDRAFRAACVAVAVKHEIKNTDDAARVVRFHVGTTAWSWGYNMVLTVKEDGSNSVVSIDIDRSGGKAVSWGSGKKEVLKILDAIQAIVAQPEKGN